MQLVMARARFRAVIFVQENSVVVVTPVTADNYNNNNIAAPTAR